MRQLCDPSYYLHVKQLDYHLINNVKQFDYTESPLKTQKEKLKDIIVFFSLSLFRLGAMILFKAIKGIKVNVIIGNMEILLFDQFLLSKTKEKLYATHNDFRRAINNVNIIETFCFHLPSYLFICIITIELVKIFPYHYFCHRFCII